MNSNPKAYEGKILIYEHNTYWDISTKEKAEAAFKQLFKILDEAQQCYWQYQNEDENLADIDELTELKKQLEAGTVPAILKAEAEHKVAELPKFEYYHAKYKRNKMLYEKAKAGDVDAIYKLLDSRKDYENENWRIEKLKNPLLED